jgi:hypothetical protein
MGTSVEASLSSATDSASLTFVVPCRNRGSARAILSADSRPPFNGNHLLAHDLWESEKNREVLQ